jgi:integrase
MPKSTLAKRNGKAGNGPKPYADFPLTPHPTGRWCKKVRGKLYYFGPLADPDAALTKWERERDYLLTGRVPPANPEGVAVRDLCNGFLAFKKERVTTGELSVGMWAEYKRATDAIVATFGPGRLVADLIADDFTRLRTYLARGRGLVALSALIRKSKICFKWGYDDGLLDRPMRYGQAFTMPAKSALRKERAKKGRQDFMADEILAMLKTVEARGEAGLHLRAFILLGVNCGLGSSDIGSLPASALSIESGMLDYPRSKTGVRRRCALWPETIAACSAAMAIRPKEKSPELKSLAFITLQGNSYLRHHGEGVRVDGIAPPFRALCKAAGVEQAGRGFYGLRRTLATVADEARDPVALRHMLGHAAPSSDMSDVYRQTISDDRLKVVSDHVRKWLFAGKHKIAKVKRASVKKPSPRPRNVKGN